MIEIMKKLHCKMFNPDLNCYSLYVRLHEARFLKLISTSSH